MTTADISPGECPAYYTGYVGLIPPDKTLLDALDDSRDQLLAYLAGESEGRRDYAYAPGKWTIREALQHVIDTERIFSTRALRISRGDRTPLPGYEQDDYVAFADVSARSLADMAEEFRTVRAGTYLLFKSMAPAASPLFGTMSGNPTTARAIGFIMSGHVYHHVNLYRERYA